MNSTKTLHYFRYQTTNYNSLYNLCKIPKVQNTIWSIFPRIPHSSYSLLWRYIHTLLKNSEKIGGHVLNKKNILSVLHAPLFHAFSRRTQLVCDVLNFSFTSLSIKVTNPLVNVTKMPPSYSSLPSSTKNATFYWQKCYFEAKSLGLFYCELLSTTPRRNFRSI